MIERRVVLWFGRPPDDATAERFKERDLELRFPAPEEIAAHLAESRGAVCRFSFEALGNVRRAFTALAGCAADHGILVYLLADNDVLQGYFSELLESVLINPPPIRRSAPLSPHEIAERMARHAPGPPCSAEPEISIADECLDDVGRVLVRRAFPDCARVSLTPLPGGRTASVFHVLATFRDSVAGTRPLPFFAKIGPRDKIAEERGKYRDFVEHFIPFNLRPNLHRDRCITGSAKGILVGDFVENAELLWDVVRRNDGAGGTTAIRALFDDTLRGWVRQPFEAGQAVAQGPVAAALPSIFAPRKVRAGHLAYARDFGVSEAPIELWEALLGLAGQRYRRAPMHGDLHGLNVFVRGRDAILIDFASVEMGPVTADMASLDTWLAFELPPDADFAPIDQAEWRQTIDELYAPERFWDLTTGADGRLLWLRTSIRQLRSRAQALCSCATEHPAAIAVYLLRRTMYDGDSPADAARRGYAYVTAARIIRHLSGKR